MQDCNQITAELKAFVDGELTAAQKTAVERHIDACPDCRRELNEIHRISSQLRELDTAVPGPELRTRILAQIVPAHEPLRRPKAPFWRSWMPGLGLAGVAAAATVIFVYTYKTPPVSTLEALKKDESKIEAPREVSEGKSAAGTPTKAPAKAPAASTSAKTNKPDFALKTNHNPANASAVAPTIGPKVVDGPIERLGLTLHKDRAEGIDARRRDNLMPPATAPAIAPSSALGARSDSYAAGKAAVSDLSASEDKKPKIAETSPAAKQSAPSGLQSFGAIVQPQQPTVDIVVDHLESGVDRVNAVAKAEGGVAERTQVKDGGPPQALFFVTIPAKNYDAFKNRLNAKDANTLYMHFPDSDSVKLDANSRGAQLNRSVQQPGNSNFSFQSDLRGQKAEGPQAGGGRGGFGLGGGQALQQNIGKPTQQGDTNKGELYNRNAAANSQTLRAKNTEQRAGNVKGQVNAPESPALLKEQVEKRVGDKTAAKQNGMEKQNQAKAGGRAGGYGGEKLGYKDKANLYLNVPEESENGTVRFTVRLRESSKPSGNTKQP